MLQHLWMALLRCASARWQLAAQAFNQAIERIKRAKLDCQLAYFLEFATSLHTLFDTNFNFGCKQVGSSVSTLRTSADFSFLLFALKGWRLR